MTLSVGARLGPYEILSLIGVGGMGEVYTARDTRLDRAVGVKVLLNDPVDRPDRRRRFETVLAAIARREWLLQMLALGAAGCRDADDPAWARGSTVVMAVPDLRVLEYDAWGFDFLTFLPLTRQNVFGELEGCLATNWEHSSDHREYTFHLRNDVRWDDGVRVTAHDVQFTIELMNHPDVREWGPFDAVTVIDDFTVQIRAASPDYIAEMACLPRHLLRGLDPKQFWQWDFWIHRVGNGPYRFVRYVPQTMIEFERNPDYYGAKPRIERVILKFVGEAALTELLAGHVDIAPADLTQIPRIARDPRFRIYHAVDHVNPAARAIYWKMDHPLFSDSRVRRALTLALDRRELHRLLNLPADLPITDGVFTGRQFRRREWPEPLPYDPGQARALLNEAGWADPNGDGVREKNGRRFRFTAKVSTDVGIPQLAVYVQEFLRRVGIHMEMQPVEPASMFSRLRTGDFEAWMYVGQSGKHAQRRDFGRGNSTGYDNPEAFGVIDRLLATANPDEEDVLYRRLTEIYRADMPFTRLLPYSSDWFVHRRVGGLSTPFRASPDGHFEELWVEERK